MATDWPSDARTNLHWKRPEEQQAIIITRELFDGDTSPPQAAARLDTTYEARIKCGEGSLFFLWTVIFDAMYRLGAEKNFMVRLVQLMVCLSKLPDVLDSQGQPILDRMNSQAIWRDLPTFTFHFREQVMSTWKLTKSYKFTSFTNLSVLELADSIATGHYLLSWNDSVRRYMNGTMFANLYLREQSLDGSLPGFGSMRNHAEWALEDALEVPTETAGQIMRTDIYVPAAATWILMNGQAVYGFCKTNQNGTGELVLEKHIDGEWGGMQLWRGADGFSLGRWHFWKKRFGEIALLDAREKVTVMAKQAADEMERIERLDAA